jgi:hypothetical protein
MKTQEQHFLFRERYYYDFNQCTPSKGWAQFDSQQDASYYGTWVNPSTCQILRFAEGDETLETYDDQEEFIQGLSAFCKWNEDAGYRTPKIDCKGLFDIHCFKQWALMIFYIKQTF